MSSYLQENMWYFTIGVVIMFTFLCARYTNNLVNMYLQKKISGKEEEPETPDATALLKRLKTMTRGKEISASVFNSPTLMHYLAKRYSEREWAKKRSELTSAEMSKLTEQKKDQEEQEQQQEKREPPKDKSIPSFIHAELLRHQDNVRRAKDAANFVNSRSRDRGPMQNYYKKVLEPRFRTQNISEMSGPPKGKDKEKIKRPDGKDITEWAVQDHFYSGFLDKGTVQMMVAEREQIKSSDQTAPKANGEH